MTANRNIPTDFNTIEELFETNPSEIPKLLGQANNIIIYDTCTFAYHSNKYDGRYYSLDFFNSNDVVIFLDSVLREMKYKDTQMFPQFYIEYFRELRGHVKAFIFIDERNYIDLLKYKFSTNDEVNVILKTAYACAFQQNNLILDLIKKLNVKDAVFYDKLLILANDEKHNKNRGEIGIFVAVQLLCRLKQLGGRYRIFTDDYSAFPYMRNLTEIVQKYYPKASIGYLSTVKNIETLSNKLNLNYDQILEYLNAIPRKQETQLFIRELPYDNVNRAAKNNQVLAQSICDRKTEIVF